MRKVCFLFLALGFSSLLHAQINLVINGGKPVKYEDLDKGMLRIFYETVSVKDSLKPEKSQETDYQVLEIGEKGISRFYSDNRRIQDSIVAELVKINPQRIDMTQAMKDRGLTSTGDPQEIYKNYPAGEMTVTDHILSSAYLYKEPLGGMQWQMTADTMTVLSYLCQKAIIAFRGRQYEAWFAPELPISDGPWKFTGLPGLILAIEDAAHHYRFKAIGLETLTSPVRFLKKDYIQTSRKDVGKIQRRFAEDPMGFITNSMSGTGTNVKIKMMDENGVEKTADEMKFPYNPIELE
ncbi:MAG: GLPGLI family protein [Dysgonamonadaceae bacterium]|jgi:GLPGLI family protein|nr:GLPGLI family protein [Dysgonamonadaceae bacterium]